MNEEEKHILRMGSIGKWIFIIVAIITSFVAYPISILLLVDAGFLWQLLATSLTSLILIVEMIVSHFFFKWLIAKAKRLETKR
jgi:hypothetical protein